MLLWKTHQRSREAQQPNDLWFTALWWSTVKSLTPTNQIDSVMWRCDKKADPRLDSTVMTWWWSLALPRRVSFDKWAIRETKDAWHHTRTGMEERYSFGGGRKNVSSFHWKKRKNTELSLRPLCSNRPPDRTGQDRKGQLFRAQAKRGLRFGTPLHFMYWEKSPFRRFCPGSG